MDAFEVALLVGQAEEQATAQAIAAAKEKASMTHSGNRGAEVTRIMPKGCRA